MHDKNHMKKVRAGKRLFAVFMIIALTFAGMMGRLFYLMFVNSDKYKSMAISQRTLNIKISPTRGDILDKNWIKLATSVEAYRIDVDMNTLISSLKGKMTIQELASKLASILNTTSDKILKTLYPDSDTGAKIKFAILARQIDKSQAEAIKALNIRGLIVSSDTKREYPNNNFLAGVLGYTNNEGNGISGVELSYNKELSGTPGRKTLETDVYKNQLPYENSISIPPINGKNLVLTIDSKIQFFAEQAAENALSTYKAKAVTITVMDPNTGEILAMVNKPDFNPNSPYKTDSKTSAADLNNILQNPAVQNNFEPGSIFKVITAYTGLATGTVTDPTAYAYECNGEKNISGTIIHCWAVHGGENFIDIIKHSCNVGFMELGLKIGKPNLLKFINLFGFGQKTGVDLPGEASGIVRSSDKINTIDLSNISFGQGIGVTAVQYLAAFNSVANGGTWIRPHVMKEITHTENGNTVVDKQYDNFGKKTILDPTIVSELKQYLRRVVSDHDGVGNSADIAGYEIAGKTGTAQIPDPKTGGYNHTNYMASFAGMAPVSNPKVTLLVSIKQPSGSDYYASSTAAPVAKELFQNIFNYYISKGEMSLPSGAQGNEQN